MPTYTTRDVSNDVSRHINPNASINLRHQLNDISAIIPNPNVTRDHSELMIYS